MFRKAAVLFLAFAALPAVLVAQPKDIPKLSEAEVLKLIELQIDDDAIIARIRRGSGAAFELTPEIEKKLRGAGASDEVIRALRPRGDDGAAPLPDDPVRQTIAVWVKQEYNNDSPLVSEMRVNGNLVESFSSTSERPLGKHLKMGWNTITLKTNARPEVKDWNYLTFSIGPTRKDTDSGKTVMEPVLWSFTNRTDWSEKNGAVRHRSGPDAKEVTTTYHLFYAGAASKSRELANGDFVLQHSQSYFDNPILTSTVFVNGRPLTSFVGQNRNQVVITPFLKKGKNEVRVVSNRISNILENNYVAFKIGGPAEYNATRMEFEMKQVLNFRTTDGWVQDKKTGQWRVDGPGKADQVERTFSFQLDEEPKGK